MGCDLIIGALEVDKDKVPDWDAARQTLAALTFEQCSGTIEELLMETPEPGTPEQDEIMVEFRERMVSALDSLQSMWGGGHRCAVLIRLRASDVLVFGGGSWGDSPFAGYEDVCAVADLVWQAAGGTSRDRNDVTVRVA